MQYREADMRTYNTMLAYVRVSLIWLLPFSLLRIYFDTSLGSRFWDGVIAVTLLVLVIDWKRVRGRTPTRSAKIWMLLSPAYFALFGLVEVLSWISWYRGWGGPRHVVLDLILGVGLLALTLGLLVILGIRKLREVKQP